MSDFSGYEDGVAKTRQGVIGRLRGILRGPLDDDAWEEVEEALISADFGAALAGEVVERARERRDVKDAEAAVEAELLGLFAPRDPTPWPRIAAPGVPAVVLVVGVNGTGKTTTVAKLGNRFARRGANVILADTAGRLHTKSNLMEELAKIRRTINKRLPEATPEVIFVLDATTGQNGLSQAKAFHESSGLTGIILTKLDTTSRGGIAFAIEDALKVPVLFVGVGEKIDDLLDFHPNEFVATLFA